jgi:hypothetical protein
MAPLSQIDVIDQMVLQPNIQRKLGLMTGSLIAQGNNVNLTYLGEFNVKKDRFILFDI